MSLQLPCNQCGALVDAAQRNCPVCGESLADERREAYLRGQIKPVAHAQPASAPAPEPAAPYAADEVTESDEATQSDGSADLPNPMRAFPGAPGYGEDPAPAVARAQKPTPAPDGVRRPHELHLDPDVVPELLTDDEVEIIPDPFFGPIERRTERYFVNRHLIEFRHGLLGKHSVSIALWRIGSADADIQIEQSLIQRARNVGDLIFETSDRDTPNFRMKNVRNPRAWQALINEAARQEQMKRNPWNTADSGLLGGPRGGGNGGGFGRGGHHR